ncbi:Outer membrane protein assembly factor BamB, contains PQQ-like beta-propeller repeat [Neorhodopirellula lusitana]|uniref:Outer membrane protein assembly factor BamB, contains PQQ-like beta-propeller repeat n=1 Tax=Neorhodopirellula lusitana TaxID=445327 RepID=A0ABY1QS03_9BACT|nr:PQQ-binding-like beta-propeller repeat protein [Neorhodopirellula lusitana]SMP78671.1 Outer membrane protein assembly factor BamB, contains PQQ-like beta-propeller repeat [Neorhodopirellula lusitana]
MPPIRNAPLVLLIVVWFATSFPPARRFEGEAFAGDWPQVLGPNRDGKAVGETIVPWTAPPKIRWRVPCGAGYAGVAVTNGKVLLWHRQDEHELLDCLSTEDGQRLWQAKFPAVYRGGVEPDLGPRCVPLVSGEHVFVYGAAGDLSAVSIADGTTLWTRQLRTDYAADDGYFGAGSSPIVFKKNLIVPVGGSDDAGLVAVNTSDGQTRWTAVDQEAAYSSPVKIEIDGQTRIIAALRLQTVMIDPESGKVLSEIDFGKRGPTVIAATPLIEHERMLLTAAYGVGCRMLDMSVKPPKDLWSSSDVISSQYATPVHIGDWLYAITGREDFGTGELLCARWSDGKVTWRQPGFGTAHLIGAGDRVLSQLISGRLELFAADASKFRSLAETELPAGIYRALPALSAGTLYCRRSISSSEGELIAIDLK